MNIRDFRYLVAVADTLHFGKAAEQCFVSQPTLSMQIRKLEETLGVQLLERVNKRVLLTDAGSEIVRRVRQILTEIDDLTQWATNHQDPLKGSMRLGIIPTLGPYLLPHVFTALHQALPDLELLLREDQTEHLLDQLNKGTLDCAVLALPVPEEGLESRVIFKEAFVLALPPNHQLANRKRVTVADLEGGELLLLDEGHCLRDQALDVCSATDVSEKHDFRATSLETLRQMVAAGTGITLLPELAVTGVSQPAITADIAFKSPVPYRTIGAIWRQGSPRHPAVELVCKIIEKQIKPFLTLKR